MQWTVRLETTTSAGEVTTTELVTFSRPAVVSTLAEVGLVLAETKALLSRLQASVLCGQVEAYAAHHRACVACGMLQPLKDLLSASPANQESVRIRTHATALRIEADDRQAAAEVTAVRNEPDKAGVADERRPIVMLDGAYIRAVPGHQVRNFEAICGKVEQEGHPTRRFAVVRSVAEQPHAVLRAALHDQGWREGDAVTAISDGDPTLPALVRSATGGPVEPILDWFHLSMRMHHVEQVMGGLSALEPPPSTPPDQAQTDPPWFPWLSRTLILVANSPARQAGHPSRPSPPGFPRQTQAGQTVLPMNKQATLNSPPDEPRARARTIMARKWWPALSADGQRSTSASGGRLEAD